MLADISRSREIEARRQEAQEPLSLDALLAQITFENLHREVDTGPAVGSEAW